MISLEPPYRRATPDDARYLAEFINAAGEGLPLYLWAQMAGEGGSAWETGCARASRDTGSFSWRNAVVREDGAEVVACLIGYPLEDDPAPTDYADMPAMFVPLQQLEDMVPGTWYLNAIATAEAYRGRGYGAGLLGLAEPMAASLQKRGVSLIVADSNEGARRLYAKLGYRELARRPMVKERWVHPGSHWVLMAKALGSPSA